MDSCAQRISDRLLRLAWDSLLEPEVGPSVAKALRRQLPWYDEVFVQDKAESHRILKSDFRKKRLLVELFLKDLDLEAVSCLLWALPGLEEGPDLLWLHEQYAACVDVNLRPKWLRLLLHVFDATRADHVELYLAKAKVDPVLEVALQPWIGAVTLDSPEAGSQRRFYQDARRRQDAVAVSSARIPVTPPPQERIQIILNRFEQGEKQVWSQLQSELSLTTSSWRYEDDLKDDITCFPGWIAAIPSVRTRILECAKGFLVAHAPDVDDWYRTHSLSWDIVGGVRALGLLMGYEGILESLPNDVWRSWAGVFVGFPNFGESNTKVLGRAVTMAFSRCPDEISQAIGQFCQLAGDHAEIVLPERLRGVWNSELAENLHAIVVKFELSENARGMLAELLISHDHEPTCTFAVEAIRTCNSGQGNNRAFAMQVASAFLKHSSRRVWPVLAPLFSQDVAFGKAVFDGVFQAGSSHGYECLSRYVDSDLADMYIWLQTAYASPPETDQARWFSSEDYAASWRTGIVHTLKARATPASFHALERLVSTYPTALGLKWELQAAKESARVRIWSPVPPKQLRAMVADGRRRLVRDGDELLEVLIESLIRFEKMLAGETPLAGNLWDQDKKGFWRPKDEDHLSDNLKKHLEADLNKTGIILGREVQIVRKRGDQKGERTDIHVTAVSKQLSESEYSTIRVVIEVKGCWNKELWSAMETQLAERYLKEAGATHGLYVVGWFNCTAWSHTPSCKPKSETREEATLRLTAQAAKLSQGGKSIKTLLIDTALR